MIDGLADGMVDRLEDRPVLAGEAELGAVEEACDAEDAEDAEDADVSAPEEAAPVAGAVVDEDPVPTGCPATALGFAEFEAHPAVAIATRAPPVRSATCWTPFIRGRCTAVSRFFISHEPSRISPSSAAARLISISSFNWPGCRPILSPDRGLVAASVPPADWADRWRSGMQSSGPMP